jgi:probable HAF family extracellular repeat protein
MPLLGYRLPLVALFLLTALPQSARAASIQGLGFVPDRTPLSNARGVSADGTTAVGGSGGSFSREAFRWTSDGGLAGLGDLGNPAFSEATATSGDGSVVVGSSSNGSITEAFLWTPSAGMVGLGHLPGRDELSKANGVSSNGSIIVGGSSSASGFQAFRWTQPGGMEGLGFLEGTTSSGASAISADGTTIVGTATTANFIREAIRWTSEDGMVGLGDLPGGRFDSKANAVSSAGTTIVGQSRSSGIGSDVWEAFQWTPDAEMVGLGFLPGGFFSKANAVSFDGTMIVGQAGTGASDAAFVWDATNGMQPLELLLSNLGVDLAGWTLTTATAVSADGRTIVGWGTNPDRLTEAWIVVIPEPSTALLMGFGLVGLGTAVRRKKDLDNGHPAAGEQPANA